MAVRPPTWIADPTARTSGTRLVRAFSKLFDAAHMGTRFGLVMVSHQLGGFFGAWLGGKAFEASGNDDWMGYGDIVLAVGAALVHLPIRGARLPARRLAPAA
ncbi:MAG: hypothetical protein ABIX46_02385 [Burkholderiaceae bacterium]